MDINLRTVFKMLSQTTQCQKACNNEMTLRCLRKIWRRGAQLCMWSYWGKRDTKVYCSVSEPELEAMKLFVEFTNATPASRLRSQNYLINNTLLYCSQLWKTPGWIKTNFYHHWEICLLVLVHYYSLYIVKQTFFSFFKWQFWVR